MKRRDFFGLLAAVVVAPKALWGWVKRPVHCPKGLWFEGRFREGKPTEWRNYASTYTNVDEFKGHRFTCRIGELLDNPMYDRKIVQKLEDHRKHSQAAFLEEAERVVSEMT